MIGLLLLVLTILWVWISWRLASRMPNWLGILKPVRRWMISAIVFAMLIVAPFLDHIVGMRQFQKLCAEQTHMTINAQANKTTRAREPLAVTEHLEGFVIPIDRQARKIFDLDTGEMIAEYKYFDTPGGRIGGLPMLGGRYSCSAAQKGHFDEEKLKKFRSQVNLTYGELK